MILLDNATFVYAFFFQLQGEHVVIGEDIHPYQYGGRLHSDDYYWTLPRHLYEVLNLLLHVYSHSYPSLVFLSGRHHGLDKPVRTSDIRTIIMATSLKVVDRLSMVCNIYQNNIYYCRESILTGTWSSPFIFELHSLSHLHEQGTVGDV